MDKKSVRQTLIDIAYKMTHYKNYHAFRRTCTIAQIILKVGIIFGILGMFPELTIKILSLNISSMCLFLYIICNYWNNAKSHQMKKDSDEAVQKFYFFSDAKCGSETWHLYDGDYDVNKKSLEVSFVKERSFINNFFRLIRKKQGLLPLRFDDLKALRYLLLQQKSKNGYLVYATLSSNEVINLSKGGIHLKEIPIKKRNKPGRWDYAVATAKLSNALWNYPRNFKAYLMEYGHKENKGNSTMIKESKKL
ncbi:hypothetical protein JF73_17060 (plasmid) [Lactobacillus helsingborgensis]|uniref:Uncharacterized protein n=2 Tax=Lactobacillus TaxID=1578 RepID=A0AA47GHQ2_9LACO|nr:MULTISPECIES: hypothetical protein [Lactobacillus]KJY54691.1 hypothetical protein JF74_18620 [Lactobacillus melliventris]KJY60535.1 hypothetical protein JF73_17060 [Lactobacillus helsingborgensis]UZX30579.1 hypothetical protein LDX53_09385 [Lactobacillus helsingborgensis]